MFTSQARRLIPRWATLISGDYMHKAKLQFTDDTTAIIRSRGQRPITVHLSAAEQIVMGFRANTPQHALCTNTVYDVEVGVFDGRAQFSLITERYNSPFL